MAPEITPIANGTLTAAATTLAKQPSISKCAYVTFLAGNGDYVKGVVGLAKGLRKAKMSQFVEYSKMIYLDGDIQVFDNIDHLFDLPDGHFYAVMDCFCEKTWARTPQYKVGYCQQRPDKVNWAVDEMGPKPALYFNAGMFVYEPSLAIYDELMKKLKITPPTPFAEQDFLNMFFRDVYRPIPNAYNLVLAMLWRHPENVQLEKVKVVHYCAAGSKPWRYTGEEENMEREDIKMLVKKWWEIYEDESLDYGNWVGSEAAAVVDPEAVNVQPFLAALSEAGVLHYVTAPSAA
ncbi:unnamed protein product [Linum tenue]|uniref:Hexosyltransferase n=1 Tax=Linum tenue TaxID=586396 RepID=A0AAV0R2A7_9ROSI|nr:unnamed protein product [Linum tenue]